MFFFRRSFLQKPRIARTLFSSSGGGTFSNQPQIQYGSATSNLPVNYGVRVVPQQKAWVVERLGKFHTVLDPGLHFLIPVVDRIAYVHSLKEEALAIPGQMAISKDNVTLGIDGVLYIKIEDPVKASYGVDDAIYAVTQLAQTTMRSEIGKLKMDTVFQDRENLNANIVEAINNAGSAWGVRCLRYEIRDISPPNNIKAAMELQAEAERRKRADILTSEGEREATINIAEGERQKVVKAAEAEGEAISINAAATSAAVEKLASAIKIDGGEAAVSLRVAEQYVDAFGELAQKGTTVILPSNPGDISSMVTSALTTFNAVTKGSAKAGFAKNALSVKEDSEENSKEDDGINPVPPPPGFTPKKWD
eukprot:g216.t1